MSEASRVADALREAILSGEMPDGTRLPSLAELAQTYGVSPDVARQAVAALRRERLVVTRHGAGTFVSRFALIVRSSPGRLARDRWGAGADIQDADTGPRPRTVGTVVAEVPAPEFAATALDVEPGSPVLARSRRFLVEDRPVQLATSYLPLDIVRGTAATYTDTGPGGLYARLADLGHAPARFTERVTARGPYPDERTALEMPAGGGLVFEIVRHAFTETGRCVEVNRMVLDAAVYELEYTFDA
jgi:GntR family transcriptional regulator